MPVQQCLAQSPASQKHDTDDMLKLSNNFNDLLQELAKFDSSLPKELKVNINAKRYSEGSAYNVGSKIGSVLLNEIDSKYDKNINLLTHAQQAASYLQDLSETINYNKANKCKLNANLDKRNVQTNLTQLEKEIKRMSSVNPKIKPFISQTPDFMQSLNSKFENSITDFPEKYSYIEAELAESTISPERVKEAALKVFKEANGDKDLAEAEIQKSIKSSTEGLDSIVVRNSVRQYPVAVGEKLIRYGSAFDAEASNPAVISLKNNIMAANSIRLELKKIK
jgi:hypothetical protein